MYTSINNKVGEFTMLLGSMHFFNETNLAKPDKITKKNLELAAQQLLFALEKRLISKDDLQSYFYEKKDEQPDAFEEPNYLDNKKLYLIGKSLEHIQQAESILQNTEDSLPFKPTTTTEANSLLSQINYYIPNKYKLSEFSKKTLKKTLLIIRKIYYQQNLITNLKRMLKAHVNFNKNSP